MVMIASLHLYANETDSMDDSIEALHELTHFFYSKLTPIYGIVRECTENTIFSVTMPQIGDEAWNKNENSSSRTQSSRPFNQHATEGQLQILMRPLIFN